MGYIWEPGTGLVLVGLGSSHLVVSRARWLSSGLQTSQGGGHLTVRRGKASVMGHLVVLLSIWDAIGASEVILWSLCLSWGSIDAPWVMLQSSLRSQRNQTVMRQSLANLIGLGGT